MADTNAKSGSVGWHPVDLPGLPHGAPGPELRDVVAGRVEAVPGPPRGRTPSGRQMPHGSQRAKSSVVAGRRKHNDGGQNRQAVSRPLYVE
jgi:hypothetical protein